MPAAGVDPGSRVELRAFQPEPDTALLATWLARPHVARWWGEPLRALAAIGGHDPGARAIVTLDGRPVGYLCWQSPARAERDAAGLAGLPGDLVDIDVLIGEPDALGAGIGPQALQLLFARLRARGVRLAGLGSALDNRRALRAWVKAGLRPYCDYAEQGQRYRYFVISLAGADPTGLVPGAAPAAGRANDAT
jgi:aminoglycoside 6'-N-acetyltransferase